MAELDDPVDPPDPPRAARPPDRMARLSPARIAAAAAGVVVFALLLRRADLPRTAALIAEAGPLLLLGLLPYTLQIGLDALSWRRLLRALGQAAPWRRLFAIRLSTEAVLMSVPGGGIAAEALKPHLLFRTDRVPAADTVATLAVGKSLLVLAQAVSLGAALGLGYGLFAAHSRAVLGGPGLPWLVAAGVLFLLVVAIWMSLAFVSGGLADRAYRFLAWASLGRLGAWLSARRSAFERADASFRALGAARLALLGGFALLVGAWMAEALETWVLLRLLGVALGAVQVLAMETAVVFLRSVIFFIPAGLGVQDAGYLAFLGAYGVPAAAPAFVIIKRAKETVWIAVGYVVFFLLRRRPESRRAPA